MAGRYKVVVIGGSAGSFQVVVRILQSLPTAFALPVILCLHRLKHVRSGFDEALSLRSSLPVVEPNDKEREKLRGKKSQLKFVRRNVIRQTNIK